LSQAGWFDVGTLGRRLVDGDGDSHGFHSLPRSNRGAAVHLRGCAAAFRNVFLARKVPRRYPDSKVNGLLRPYAHAGYQYAVSGTSGGGRTSATVTKAL